MALQRAVAGRTAAMKIVSTYCFIDLAGFSALTEAHGDAAAADLVQSFCRLVDQARNGHGRVVKTIGDAVFLSIDSVDEAVQFLSRLWPRAVACDDFPVLRVGLHYGEAIERDGDVFGAAVNLAARIASQARGDEVLATSAVAQAARRQGIDVTKLGFSTFRNMRQAVELYSLHLTDEGPLTTIDPVYHMRVDRRRAAGILHFREEKYWFCSLECAARFGEDPRSFVA